MGKREVEDEGLGAGEVAQVCTNTIFFPRNCLSEGHKSGQMDPSCSLIYIPHISKKQPYQENSNFKNSSDSVRCID